MNLSFIPTEIGLCTNLMFVNLRANRNLKALPSEIAKLTKLTYLNIGNTGVTTLPDEVLSMKNTQDIQIVLP